MSDGVLKRPYKRSLRFGGSRVLLLVCMILLPAVYTCLTLYGSLDFLLKAPGVIRLQGFTKAPIYAQGVGPFGEALSLPDDWRDASEDTRAWRYAFVFELPHELEQDQDVYFPQLGDNGQITINGNRHPYFGSLQGSVDIHWSSPLVFAVAGSEFRAGRNELLVDVYANERALGSLYSLSIGPRGSFALHQFAVMATKSGLAYVLLAIDIFAIFALLLYAAAVSGQFYLVSVGIGASMLGGLLPHLIDSPWGSIGYMFCCVIACFIVLQSCCVYLCSLLFPVDQRILKVILLINCFNTLAHLALPSFVNTYKQLLQVIIYPNLLALITGVITTALLVRRFIRFGDGTVSLLMLLAFFITTLGVRDFLVIWGWLPAYQGFYTLHGIGVMVLCLGGIIVLRIRAGYREQSAYRKSMQRALARSRESMKQATNGAEEQTLDKLVSRIATTYSHEFRNPLAAALATNKVMLKSSWEPNASLALHRMQRSILTVSDSLNRQFDFQRALQSSNSTYSDTKLPSWLMFVRDYQSCKIVWLSNPEKMPEDSQERVKAWLKPLLEEFGKIPSVCMIHQQKYEVVLHLYLHINEGDVLQGSAVDGNLLKRLQPESIRETADGRFLYWRNAY